MRPYFLCCNDLCLRHSLSSYIALLAIATMLFTFYCFECFHWHCFRSKREWKNPLKEINGIECRLNACTISLRWMTLFWILNKIYRFIKSRVIKNFTLKFAPIKISTVKSHTMTRFDCALCHKILFYICFYLIRMPHIAYWSLKQPLQALEFHLELPANARERHVNERI